MLQSLPCQWSGVVSPEELHAVDRFHQVISDITEMTAKLDEVKIERERLDKRIFALRAPRAPITRIPDEILEMIFESGAETVPMFHNRQDSDSTFQEHCLQVCQRWRRVCTSYQSLWTSYSIHDIGGICQLELYLAQHNKTFPISIELQEAITCHPRNDVLFIRALSKFFASTSKRLASVGMGIVFPHV
ncbi:hypothetical protein CALCODRAFT_63995 [Calocera cornea HHB12733]|uniref:Uncharacterized protein n=1 Tax=Calocera cornea HHB12733 TaxID=1353952 RepID=A0A165DLN6_9BASI|nr:hypothetical protein CALCODRAFT_63995 [Calocera cornea HHB12733]